MFTIKLSDPKLFNNLISVLSEFVTESTFSIEKDGLKLVAIDPANVAMVTLNILPSAFAEYSVSEDEEVTLNLEKLKLALKRAKPTDIVTIKATENKLNIAIAGSSNRRFAIPMLEKSGADRSKQDFDFKTTVGIKASDFKEFVDDTAVVSDAVTFEAESSKFTISAGDTGSQVRIDLSATDEAITNIESKEKSRSIYSVNYLKKMAKAASVSDVANISFANDYPLRMEFKALNQCVLSFILAPRIESR